MNYSGKRSAIVIGAAIVLALIAVVFLAARPAADRNSPAALTSAETTERFWSDLRARRTEDSYALTSANFKAKTDPEQFRIFAEQVNQQLPPGELQLISQEAGLDAAETIVFQVEGEGVAFQLAAEVKLENGRWQVEGVQVMSRTE